jgi:hypothetical protein
LSSKLKTGTVFLKFIVSIFLLIATLLLAGLEFSTRKVEIEF